MIGFMQVEAQTSKVAPEGRIIDEVAAIVGGNIIMLSDIEAQYLQYRLQGTVSGSPEEVKCRILESIMVNKLFLNQAELDSITVTPKEVDRVINERMNYFISQIGSKEKLEEFYNKKFDDIKNDLRAAATEQMTIEQMQQQLTTGVKVTPSDVAKFYKEMPADSIPMVNIEFEVGQIVKYPKMSLADEIEVKDKLRSFRRRIMAGDDFAVLARLYSEDPGSAAKGGDLGFFNRGELEKEYEAVAYRLNKGEISDVVKTRYGYHIIQMMERRGDMIQTRHILIKPKVSASERERAALALDSIANGIKSGSLTFDQAVGKYSDDANRLNGGLMINPYTRNSKFEPDQMDAKVLYAIDKLKIGEITSPMMFTDDEGKDGYRILYLKARTESHRANINTDYDKLQQWALSFKKYEEIDKWVDKKIKTTYIKVSPSFGHCSWMDKWKN